MALLSSVARSGAALALAGLFALAAPACATSNAQGAGANAVTLHAPPIRARDIEDRFIRLKYDLVLTEDGDAAGTSDGTWSTDEQRRVTVLATRGDAVSELRVSYGERQGGPLLGVPDRPATDGNTYLVRTTGSGASIRRSDGRPISPEERADVAAEYGDVGKPAPLLALLASGKLKAGATLTPSAEAVRALLGTPPGMDVQDADVTLSFVGFHTGRRPLAELAVSVRGRLVNGKTVFDLDLSGPARVDLKTGWLSSLHLEGKAKAHGKLLHGEHWYDVSGAGTAVITRSAGLG